MDDVHNYGIQYFGLISLQRILKITKKKNTKLKDDTTQIIYNFFFYLFAFAVKTKNNSNATMYQTDGDGSLSVWENYLQDIVMTCTSEM